MPPLRGLLELFEAPLKVDAGTQTVMHVQERLIDVNYEWNEWALRRRVGDWWWPRHVPAAVCWMILAAARPHCSDGRYRLQSP
jgi:hypothetical protein